MSADACVVFYGLRFEVAPKDIEALEARTDSRILVAQKAGLKHYWANFGLPGERYLLFVGYDLGVLGPEDKLEVFKGCNNLQALMESTKEKLDSVGLAGEPTLYLQWWIDAS